MQQIKIFKGIESDLGGLEGEINVWLKSSNARVVQMFGNIAPQSHRGEEAHRLLGAERAGGRTQTASDVLVAVLYETA